MEINSSRYNNRFKLFTFYSIFFILLIIIAIVLEILFLLIAVVNNIVTYIGIIFIEILFDVLLFYVLYSFIVIARESYIKSQDKYADSYNIILSRKRVTDKGKKIKTNRKRKGSV